MDWFHVVGVCTLCLVFSVAAQTADADPAASDLQFCLPTLKGYQFENSATQRCYEFVTKEEDRLSWGDAKDYCQMNGGRLINIEDNEKQLMLEGFLDEEENKYKPSYSYDALNSSTWADYDPDVWLGAQRDSDGTTWRFDQYATSRTVRSVVLTWFNYGSDPTLIREQNAEKNRFAADTCLIARFNWGKTVQVEDGKNVTNRFVKYPWYNHQMCSNPKGHKHPYICEYEGYEYRSSKITDSKWLIVIVVLASFLCCGFISCTIYCLWDKIHTSYNVLQV